MRRVRQHGTIWEMRDFSRGLMGANDFKVDGYLALSDSGLSKNCIWVRKELHKMAGKELYASITVCGTGIYGAKEAVINDTRYLILALDNASGTFEFHRGISTDPASGFSVTIPYPNGTAHTMIGSSDTDGNMYMSQIGEALVAVNGLDKPRVIYPLVSGTLVIDTLDSYDTRNREDLNWVAGRFTASGTMTDDTTDAQSSASSDFEVGATTSSGFFIGCDYTFNKFVIKDFGASQSTSMTLQYYGIATGGSTTEDWQTISPLATVTFTATGDKSVEWNFPIGSDGTILPTKIATSLSTLDGKYAVRGKFLASFSATALAQGFSVHHTQYISQLFLGEHPKVIATHKQHLFLGKGRLARVSPANSLKGWRYQDYFYFHEGEVLRFMGTHLDYLLVMLEKHKYGIRGNSWSNWTQADLGNGGTLNQRNVIVTDKVVFYLDTRGLNMWDGNTATFLSEGYAQLSGYPFQTQDSDKWDASGVVIEGVCYLHFGAGEKVLMWDQSALYQDGSTVRFAPFVYENTDTSANTDFLTVITYPERSQQILMISNTYDAIVFMAKQVGKDYDISSATNHGLDMVARIPTKYFSGFSGIDNIRRTRWDVKQCSVTGCATHYVFFYSFANGTSATVSFEATIGTAQHRELITVPYTMSGPGLHVGIEHNSSADAALYGVTFEGESRGF